MAGLVGWFCGFDVGWLVRYVVWGFGWRCMVLIMDVLLGVCLAVQDSQVLEKNGINIYIDTNYIDMKITNNSEDN